jgi:hypothetical protein
VRVWTIKPPPVATLFTPQLIGDTLTNALWPKLRDGITNGLAIKLPLPPLGSLASIAPSLAGLTLHTGLNRLIDGWTRCGAS